MYISKLKKILTWTLMVFLLITNLLGFSVPKKTQAESRPANCKTSQGSSVITTGEQAYWQRCATTSTSGYTLHLWRGDETKAGSDEEFVFVAGSDFGTLGLGDIGDWVFRSKSSPDFYIAVKGGSNAITLTHHFRAGTETRWNQYATESTTNDRDYHLMPGSTLPQYYQGRTSPEDKFVWRIVTNGTILLNDSPVADANIKAHVDQKGPPLDDAHSGSDGKFEFSYVGTNADIWINQGTVQKMAFYVGLTKDDKNYEITKYVDIPGGWTQHSGHDDTKIINLGDIKLTDSNKVDTLTEKPGGEQSIIEETFGSSKCETQFKCDSQGIFRGTMCKAQCTVLEFISSAIAWVIKTILYPSLGLSTNGYNDPNNPSTTTSNTNAPSTNTNTPKVDNSIDQGI